MKCIIAVKSTKNMEVGTIKRVDDLEAEQKVRVGFFNYISKSEWKKSRGIVESKVVEPEKTISDSIAYGYGLKEETISEKQLKRKKQK